MGARNKKPLSIELVHVEKLVHGGQGMGRLKDGRKVFVWGALPGEDVQVQLTKRKKDWAEGIAIDVEAASSLRITPQEPGIYLATSPWQILDYHEEAVSKQSILAEAFSREGIQLAWRPFVQPDKAFGYRNKMEYNFWFDTETERVSLALHRRGTHQKASVRGSALAHDALNAAGDELINYVNEHSIEARPLKSVIIRTSQDGQIGMCLFVKDVAVVAAFAAFRPAYAQFEIVYSNPKSPASVATDVLRSEGVPGYLEDRLLGQIFRYTTRSFFQVNVPIYDLVLREIRQAAAGAEKLIDLYSGVGSIGLSVVSTNQHMTLVELSAESTAQANQNAAGRENCTIVTASSEASLDYIAGADAVIVDPPRAGLHELVVQRIVAEAPSRIVYLSCNPSTQARDVRLLVEGGYEIEAAQGYNFFPRTPHIESLLVLRHTGAI